MLLIKELTEATMQEESDSQLDQELAPNRKSDSAARTVNSTAGTFELKRPRNRAGTFKPRLIKQYQPHLADEIELKILGL